MDNRKIIQTCHGSGGEESARLLRETFFRTFRSAHLQRMEDAAILDAGGERWGFTTDSFVISPLFFNGGDIGKLSVCGTVNDLAVMGVIPRFISCGFILEEGLPVEILERVVLSMNEEAESAGVEIVTGDTKVVERGKADGLFINTAGIGPVNERSILSLERIDSGDMVIINGPAGNHGMAVTASREGLDFQVDIKSDCASLGRFIHRILDRFRDRVKYMRDPTRGGISAILNEIAGKRGIGLILEEGKIPVEEGVRTLTEILGIDPLSVANEGKVIMFVDRGTAGEIADFMKGEEAGMGASIIGEVVDTPAGRVLLNTTIGGRRIVEMPRGELLPRIC